MKKHEGHVSVMQEEVWKMKDKVFVDTKGLDAKDFFCYIKDKCKKSKVCKRHHASAC